MSNGERALRVLAPAKINLYLRVTGRRPDGYHLLDSLMAPVDLFDELQVSVRAGERQRVTCECDAADVPSGPRNLAYRAAEMFLAHSDLTADIHIRLAKRIPAGSGLGGGSSDAAAVLVTLNRLLEARRRTADLAAMAVQLGADVPFFIVGRPARVAGIGEIVTPVAAWGGIPLVIAFPQVAFATQAIYEWFDAAESCSGGSLTKPASATTIAAFAGSRTPLRELLVNDLEAVAVAMHPEVRSLKSLLVQLGAEAALMTGSGSAVFGIWPARPAAETAAAAMRGRGIWAVAAETLEVSPAAA